MGGSGDSPCRLRRGGSSRPGRKRHSARCVRADLLERDALYAKEPLGAECLVANDFEPSSCPNGCCSGDTCVPYASQSGSDCGTGGAACAACTSGQTCSTAGVCTAHTFRGGPCAFSTSGTSVELFARGDNNKIYRGVVDAQTPVPPTWTVLSDLDGSLVDNLSDLDCGGSASTVHIVALGRDPVGVYLHAYGTGTLYNGFEPDVTDYTFSYSPGFSLLRGYDDSMLLGGTIDVGRVYAFQRYQTTTTTLIPSPTFSAASAVDIWDSLTSSSSASTFIAALTSSSELAIYSLNNSAIGGDSWGTPIYLAPPAGQSFQYSPSVCSEGAKEERTGISLGVSGRLRRQSPRSGVRKLIGTASDPSGRQIISCWRATIATPNKAPPRARLPRPLN